MTITSEKGKRGLPDRYTPLKADADTLRAMARMEADGSDEPDDLRGIRARTLLGAAIQLDANVQVIAAPQDRDVGGDWRFTPMEVEMLLHLYAIAEPLPRMFATVREAALQSFIERGFVRPSKSSGSGYRTTKLGERVVNAICNPSTPPSVAVIPDGWQPIETQPDFMERPGRQFIRIEGEAEHSGMCWSRVWCGEAYIRKEGADDEMLGYRKSDILRLCKDGDMIPSSARVTHWMPARFPLLTLSASPSPALNRTTGERLEAEEKEMFRLADRLGYVCTPEPHPDSPHVQEQEETRIAIKDEAREEAAKTIRRQIDALLEKYGSRERDTNATILPPEIEDMIAELSEREEEILLLKGQP